MQRCFDAIKSKDLFALQQSPLPHSEIAENTALLGYLEGLIWVAEQGLVRDWSTVLELAASQNHTDCLQYILDVKYSTNRENALIQAMMRNHIESINLLLENYDPPKYLKDLIKKAKVTS